ncbi:hypothetical protein R1flu_010450 [Riccia fluitans]|uniref:Uncharacterized protein n=1 Tax=Riccia fluitans TaxID=41844 RepID=A0ABD1Z549_9MARC
MQFVRRTNSQWLISLRRRAKRQSPDAQRYDALPLCYCSSQRTHFYAFPSSSPSSSLSLEGVVGSQKLETIRPTRLFPLSLLEVCPAVETYLNHFLQESRGTRVKAGKVSLEE